MSFISSSNTGNLFQKWSETIWLLIALSIPLFVNFWVEQPFEAAKVWLLRPLVGLLAICWIAQFLTGRLSGSLPSILKKLIVILVLIISMATALSDYPHIAIFGTLERANGMVTQLCYVVLFGCVATQLDLPRSHRLLIILMVTAVPISLLGLVQAAVWQPFPLLTDARSALTTTLGRANFTGAYLALLLPLTAAAYQQAVTENKRTIMYVILAGLQITVIILSQARAAAIAALAGVLIFLWLQYAPNWSRPRRWLSILSTGVVGVSTLLFIGRWAIASGGSIAARWTIWNASLKLLWLRLWLGYGADTVELYFPSVYPPQLVYYQGRGVVVDRAHNWLLDWSLSYGLVATFVLIAVIGFILQAGWQQLVTSPTPSRQRLEPHWIAACMVGVGAQLVGNLFLFEVASTAVVFWLLLAIIVSAAVQETEPQIIGKRPFWQQATGISITLLIVGWLIWFGSVRPLLADRHSWLGTHALNEGNPSAALEEYKAAVQYQPQRNAYQVAFALTAAHLGDFEQAEQSLKQAIRYRPNDYILYTHLAAVYGTQAVANASPQKLQLAYNAYEKALAFAPTIGLTYQQYADLALRSGDETMAVKQAQKAVNLDATDGIAFGILGWAQLYSGNLLAAQNAFEQALTWQPDSADFHLGLATVYFQQNRFDAAKEMVKQSLIRDPTYAPALTLQLQLQDK